MPEEAALLSTAQAEGVLAFCHDRLRRSPAWERYSATLRAALTQHVRQEVAVEMLRAVELREVLAALARQGLSVLLLKGAALAHTLYPEPHLRSRCDTDLLLPSREAAERAERVLQALGYQQPMAITGDLTCHELGCYKTGPGGLTHALDIHWRMSNATLFGECFTFTELAAAAVPIPALGPYARGLGPVHALLLAGMHRVANMSGDIADRLIWLYDIHLLAQRFTSEQWSQLVMLAEERFLCGPCFDGLHSTQIGFGTTLPDAVLNRLRAGTNREGFDPRHAHPQWRFEWLTFCSLPPTMRLRWLGQYLFPSARHMRDRYGFRHLLWLPWFYGVRIVRRVSKLLYQRR